MATVNILILILLFPAVLYGTWRAGREEPPAIRYALYVIGAVMAAWIAMFLWAAR